MSKLSTGKIPFTIEFDTEDTETIYFNPNDLDIMVKLKELPERMKDVLTDDFELKNDGTPKDENFLEEFTTIRNKLYEEVDKIFDSPVSEKVFKHCNAFAIVDGKYFFELFIEYILPKMQQATEKSLKAVNKHLDKYKK